MMDVTTVKQAMLFVFSLHAKHVSSWIILPYLETEKASGKKYLPQPKNPILAMENGTLKHYSFPLIPTFYASSNRSLSSELHIMIYHTLFLTLILIILILLL